FRHHADRETFAERADQLHQVSGIPRAIQLAHEAAVNLDAVEGELVEIPERRITRAEIVEHHAHTGALETLHDLQRGVDVADERALREFHLQRRAVDAVTAQHGGN